MGKTYTARHSRYRNNVISLFETKPWDVIVFDTETTGLNPKEDYIVQLSAKKYHIENGEMELTDIFDRYIRPPFWMTPKVIDVHHITNEMLLCEPDEEELFGKIREFFDITPCIVVGYNIDFDVEMLKALYKRCGSEFNCRAAIDVLENARDLVPTKDTENRKLETIATHFGLNEGITFHSSLDDVEATARLLKFFYKEYKETEVPFKERLHVNSFSFWKGMNKQQAGIWVNTNAGKMWFSTLTKEWKSTEIDLNKYRIDEAEDYILKRMKLDYPKGYKDFGKITEKKFKEWKVRDKEEREKRQENLTS